LVWDDQGHIITNYHIVEQAAQVETIFHDGTVVPAEVVATDADSDLAVLRVDVPADRLRPLTAGDSDTVSVGQRAIAIGNPFGHRWSLTTGEIGALNQTVPFGMSPFSIPDAFLIFAGIHPHNAGGPLLDQEGRVVGVSALIRAPSFDSPGLVYVIPINLVKQLVPVLIEEGAYRYAWLGIVGRDMGPEIATAMGLPQEVAGALVIDLAEDGPADQAGLRGSETTITVDGSEVGIGGDVIVEIDDQRILGMDDLIVYLVKQTRPGQVVKLTLLRDDQVGTLEVRLGERPR
jgi:S1-C subfamily serine protease